MEQASRVRADFDRIAVLTAGRGWDHNAHYHGYLLRNLPPRCEMSLEIGCGTGDFAHLLARRSRRVVALDLSPEMIRVAREMSRGRANIEYQIADVLAWDFPAERFDCIATIATLHHLPAPDVLGKMRDALRPGGTLLVLDIYRAERVTDYLLSVVAAPYNIALRLLKTGRLREARELRQAWAEHGRHDRYPTIREVRHLCARLLPGAKVRQHLLWRYSIVWRKPAR